MSEKQWFKDHEGRMHQLDDLNAEEAVRLLGWTKVTPTEENKNGNDEEKSAPVKKRAVKKPVHEKGDKEKKANGE